MALELLTGGDGTISRREWQYAKMMRSLCDDYLYSDLLDLYILCVDHYGTSWDYVYCETTNEHAARELGESK
jgi:hypothetical protein